MHTLRRLSQAHSAVRATALRYLNALFPYHNVPARTSTLLAAGDPVPEVREEARLGLRFPHRREPAGKIEGGRPGVAGGWGVGGWGLGVGGGRRSGNAAVGHKRRGRQRKPAVPYRQHRSPAPFAITPPLLP